MKSIDELLNEDIRDNVIHGAAVLAGTLDHDFFDKGYGYAENTLTYPMNTDTVIDMASTTKTASAITALLVLHSRGLIDFDAPFTEYLKDYKPKISYLISVRDLANHTSGFYNPPEEWPRSYFNESGTVMLSNMLTMPPPFPKTEKAVYSCWNYLLLSMIVERISGKTFTAFCDDEIFKPLGMSVSSMGKVVDLPPERIAQTLGAPKPGLISDHVAVRIFRDGGSVGNAGLFSSAKDISKLLRCHLRHGDFGNGRLFSEETFKEIAPDKEKLEGGYRRFGWIIYDARMSEGQIGTSLLHEGWSGQTIYMNFAKQMYAAVLTTRCGDYERAKNNRFAVIRQLFELA